MGSDKRHAFLCAMWQFVRDYTLLEHKAQKHRICIKGFYKKQYMQSIMLYIALFFGIAHISYAAVAQKEESQNAKIFAYLEKQKPLAQIQGSFLAWQTQCAKKNYQSCYLVARAYHDGYEVVPNAFQSRKYATKACHNDIIESCAFLSSMLAKEDIADIDMIRLYRQACALDNKEACLDLKEILLQDIAQDSTTARNEEIVAILQRICRLEDDSTCYALQAFVAQTRGNYNEFLVLEFERDLQACKRAEKEYSDDMRVCGEVGRKYASGLGVASDVVEAEKYYQLACKKHTEFCRHAVLSSVLN